MPLQTNFSCVGCGRYLTTGDYGNVQFVSGCPCGAHEPLLYDAVLDDCKIIIPKSLMQFFLAQQAREPIEKAPHLEYYFGYSAAESETKNVALMELRGSHGLISQAECENEDCRIKYIDGCDKYSKLEE